MAEFLIKAVDHVHPDPDKDRRGAYKRGDIVSVRPDGWAWGSLELKAPKDGGKFVVIKITGITVQQVIDFVKARWNQDPIESVMETVVENGETISRPYRRRRFHVQVDLLPAAVRNTLNNTGQYTTTWAAVKAFVRDKVSG